MVFFLFNFSKSSSLGTHLPTDPIATDHLKTYKTLEKNLKILPNNFSIFIDIIFK